MRRPSRKQLLWAGLATLSAALVAGVLSLGPLSELGAGGEGADDPAPAGGVSLRVAVLSPDGAPVPGARVTLEVAREGRGPVVADARTSDDGTATLGGLVPGAGTLVVSASGLERATQAVTVDAGGGSVSVQLAPGGALAGTVVDEAGAPIAAAHVTVRPADDDEAAPWEATTDAQGRFAFDTLRPGPQHVEASAEGFDSSGQRVETGAQPIQLALRRTGVLAGAVTLPDGAPAPGASVVVVGSGVWPARTITTEGDGSFRITGIPPGVYEARASLGDLVSAPREGITLDSGQEVTLDFQLEPGATLRGRVVRAEDDTPIAAAEIVVAEEALAFQPRAARTGEDGTFEVAGLRAVQHRLSIHAEGFVSVVAARETPGGEPIRIALRPASVLAGRVVDTSGRPVEGAQVEVVGRDEGGATMALTGAELAFREALFEAQVAGPLPVAPGGELGVTLGEVPPIPLGPTPDVASEGAVESTGTYVTDGEGRFRLTGIPPGRMQIVARHPDHAPGFSEPVLVTAGSTREDLEITLPEGGVIEGRVVDGRGFPVGHVRVEMHSEREPWPRITMATEDGSFRFEHALGTTTLTAYPTDRPAARKTVPVGSGETVTVELALEGELTSLAARTVDDRGFPIAGAQVSVRSLRPGNPGSRAGLSAEDGTLVIPGLPPPPWRISAEHDQYATLTVQVRAADDELSLVLPPAAAIRGQVIDEWAGTVLSGATVTLGGASPAREVRTDAEGKFELRRVPLGHHEITVNAPGYLQATRAARLERGRWGVEDVALEPIALAPGGSVSGTVVDAAGAPVAGAEVAWGEAPDWPRAARTDAQGRFQIPGLMGEVSLVARHPAAGTSGPVTARAYAQQDTPGVLVRLPERFDAADVDLGEGHRTGIAIEVRDREGAVVVTSVTTGSRAADAGLRRGDVLLSIDGEEVADAESARALLRGPAGVEAIVELERRGRTVRLPVERESY